ncbi:hypothetical protein Ct9H90mP29_04530 [bacterium]|nr:MAG: hypothetical protein Ct9H90mP29_04530 [bacterium]
MLNSFELEVAPDGMTIDNGVLTWKTDSAMLKYTMFEILLRWFERTAQDFQLFSRAGVKILSKPPVVASVGTSYSYPVKVWKQKPDQKINYKLFNAPMG